MSDVRSLLKVLAAQEPAARAALLGSLSATDRRALAEDWHSQALSGQVEPEGGWRT